MALHIEKDISLAEYTTLHVGGVARYFAVLKDEADLVEVADLIADAGVPVCVLGGGSNILFSDGILPYFVVKNELKGVSFTETDEGMRITAAAGEEWDRLVAQTVEQGLSGLENLSGIPGTVGAAPIQNINAYGISVAETIESVTVFDLNTKLGKTLLASECQFGYRDSVFKTPAGAHLIVTAVTFNLAPAGSANLSYRSSSQSIARYLAEKGVTKPTVADVREAVLHVRSNIGMLKGQFCSAGSFFKNTIVSSEEFTRIEQLVKEKFAEQDKQFSPWHWSLPDGKEKISTAFLLECSPYNKHTYGEKRWRDVVGISPKHSLSIITEAGATATDVQDFVEVVTKEVKNIFDISIETEVNFIS